MLAGRSDDPGARSEAALDVALADRSDARTTDFRTVDFRLDRFEITVSPPHRQGAWPEASKQPGTDPAPWMRARSAGAGRRGAGSWFPLLCGYAEWVRALQIGCNRDAGNAVRRPRSRRKC